MTTVPSASRARSASGFVSPVAWHLGCWLCIGAICLMQAFGREPDFVLDVWPDKPPGDLVISGPERKVEGRPRPFYQLTGIAKPTLAVFLPPQAQRNGTGILVVPGGGLQRVAYEHEGLETAAWLTSKGYSAFVLKYRAPAPAQIASQDGQRALSQIRANAKDWGVDPQSIGVLGFSAGGEIGVWLATHGTERLYASVDSVDALSCRPDFAALIYPGGLLKRTGEGLKEPLVTRIKTGLPPFFVAHAFDDASENSLLLALALKKNAVPAELHLYQEGGHGGGPRRTGVPFSSWKDRLDDWLGVRGFADPALVRRAASEVVGALSGASAPPRFTELVAAGDLETAYKVQRRVVRAFAQTNAVAGFKGAAASAAAQKAMGLDRPLAGVVFQRGRLDGQLPQTIDVAPGSKIMVETEIGYLTSVDISYEVLNDEQARGTVESIVPVIELPRSGPPGVAMKAADLVAMNIGSDRYILGRPMKAEGKSPDAIHVTLRRDGVLLHESQGGTVNGGQWGNLRQVLNEITRHGYTIPAGSVILGGALGVIQPGNPGKYEADYGEAGIIRFEIRAP